MNPISFLKLLSELGNDLGQQKLKKEITIRYEHPHFRLSAPVYVECEWIHPLVRAKVAESPELSIDIKNDEHSVYLHQVLQDGDLSIREAVAAFQKKVRAWRLLLEECASRDYLTSH